MCFLLECVPWHEALAFLGLCFTFAPSLESSRAPSHPRGIRPVLTNVAVRVGRLGVRSPSMGGASLGVGSHRVTSREPGRREGPRE